MREPRLVDLNDEISDDVTSRSLAAFDLDAIEEEVQVSLLSSIIMQVKPANDTH